MALPTSERISWNPQVKLILSDVDETIADNYTLATPDMINELTYLLRGACVLFLISGASLSQIRRRITDLLPAHVRRQVLVAHCSGAEIWGFSQDGELREKPFFSLYDTSLLEKQKVLWRQNIQQLIEEFHLTVFDPVPAMQFKEKAGDDPLAIIMEDRGPQITFEVINGYDLTPGQEKKLAVSVPQTHGAIDLRIPILERAEKLFAENDLPVTPRLGGVWALDFAIKGVNKTTVVESALQDAAILSSVGLDKKDLEKPETIEIWGDKFSVLTGTDRHMSEAVDPLVRSIDFRQENPEEFPKGYNIVVWNGTKHLQEGLLEYLQLREKILQK